MFSMSPTLQNSLQKLYSQYSGPNMQAPGGQGFNPMQPLWMQGAGINPQPQPMQIQPMGPALNTANPPGMQTNPGVNPNILKILQMMMSGTPLAGPATPPATTPAGTPIPGQTPQPGDRQPPQLTIGPTGGGDR